MQFKHAWGVRRPTDRSSLIQPVILTPNHGSYPAGHSTQCWFVAEVLKELIKYRKTAGVITGVTVAHQPEIDNQLEALADRIGVNRIVAGVHYKDDIDEGKELGKRLAKYFIAKSTGKNTAGGAVTAGPALDWLWRKAMNEQWQ